MPYFKYLDWVNEFLPNVDSELQATVFLAYRQMLAGTALSNMFSGRRYRTVRQIMVSHDVARLTNDYVPLTAPAPSYRVLPVGERIVFDIYSRNRYVRNNKEYTIQIRFDVWFPLGVIRKNKYGEQLLAVVLPYCGCVIQEDKRRGVDRRYGRVAGTGLHSWRRQEGERRHTEPVDVVNTDNEVRDVKSNVIPV